MKINESRNLVIPVISEKVTRIVDGKEEVSEVVKLWAYHTPISKEVFDSNFRIISSTKATLASKGTHFLMVSATKVALLTLRDEGRRDAISRGMVDGSGNVIDKETDAFLGEIKRLTTILAPGKNGWDMIPVDSAISSGKMDEEDYEEVGSAIVFFSCHYSMSKKSDKELTARAYSSLINASITSLNLMEFSASLPILTKGEDIEKTRLSMPC